GEYRQHKECEDKRGGYGKKSSARCAHSFLLYRENHRWRAIVILPLLWSSVPFSLSPTACAPSAGSGQAVGCILSPLRGSTPRRLSLPAIVRREGNLLLTGN